MSTHEKLHSEARDYLNSPDIKEIIISHKHIFRHMLHYRDIENGQETIYRVPATKKPLLIESDFYLANVGTEEDPKLLELRFEPIPVMVNDLYPGANNLLDQRVYISLLMTNERDVIRDLMPLGEIMYQRLKEKGVEYDAILAAETLGPKLAQEIVHAAWERDQRAVYMTSFQKGKPQVKNGKFVVGAPKPWVRDWAGKTVNSGTSNEGTEQKLFFDQKIAEGMVRNGWKKILLVDDALLSGGTIDCMLDLVNKLREERGIGLEVTAIETILNEGADVDSIRGIPYIGMTNLPFSMKVPGGYVPIPGTYEGIDYFYLEF